MENMVKAQMLKEFYQGKRVFITGHTGFKGAWLTCVLHQLGAIVKGYALAPENSGGLFDYLTDNINLQSVIADIRDSQTLENSIRDFDPQFVFHLAAQPLVRRSYEIPADTFDVNVTGTARLLEVLKKQSSPCAIVVVTTDKVYHNKETDMPYQENDALGGFDPYSASKACCELVCESFRNSFFNPGNFSLHKKSLATARAGNVIGGGDWSKDRLIPDIVNALSGKSALEIRYPQSVRPWQHVLEALAGYLVLAMNLKNDPVRYSTAFNFGPLPNDHLTVKEVVEYAIAVFGKGSWKDISSETQPHESGLLKLDINRAISELQWMPKLTAREAIRWTLDWYQQPEKDRYSFSLKQIRQYFDI